MKPTWYLIANAATARLLQQDDGTPMVVLHAFHHPASRQPGRELGSAPAGREGSERSFGGAVYEPRTDVREKEHQQFAREIADYLEQAAREHRYRGLHLFAASHFLGDLKHALGDNSRKLLAGTHDVDLTAVGLTELERRIEHELAQPR